jgi:hypothetical protein
MCIYDGQKKGMKDFSHCKKNVDSMWQCYTDGKMGETIPKKYRKIEN